MLSITSIRARRAAALVILHAGRGSAPRTAFRTSPRRSVSGSVCNRVIDDVHRAPFVLPQRHGGVRFYTTAWTCTDSASTSLKYSILSGYVWQERPVSVSHEFTDLFRGSAVKISLCNVSRVQIFELFEHQPIRDSVLACDMLMM